VAPEIQILVPDIGDFEEVEVVELIVAKGDRVEVEDSLVSLESDKATMEIPAPRRGVVSEVCVQLGDRVSEGSLLLLLDADASDVADPGEDESRTPTPEVRVETQPALEEPPPALASRAAKPSRPSASAGEPSPSTPPVSTATAPTVSSATAPIASRPHASPLVRRTAREWGVDIAQAPGSGAQGRILPDDLKRHVRDRLASGGVAPGARGIPPVREVDFSRFGEVEQVPLARIRQKAGENLSRSWLNLPHVTQHDEADITELEGFRRSRADLAQAEGVKLSPLVFVMKAVVLALRRFPEFASSLAPDAKHLILKRTFHLGVAVDTEAGLVVPVVRDVDRKRVLELAGETAQLAETARARKLTPAQLQGACFTISSLGGIGGTAFTPIVNAPEVALLGVSRTFVKPVWSQGLDLSPESGGEFVPRLVLPLSLSYDHRVIDGAAAVRFTTFLKSALADPAQLLL
jgi:pyruvate dehydrogenase E2 component (dihydrolipoamide acetyltransferase)